jgi:hypothetical protein
MKEKSSNGNSFFVHRRKVSAIKRIECFNYRVSHIVLRVAGVIPNVHAPSTEKSDDSSNNIYKELGQVSLLISHVTYEILLGDFNAKLLKVDIFKPTIGNESTHRDSNDNGVRFANLKT